MKILLKSSVFTYGPPILITFYPLLRDYLPHLIHSSSVNPLGCHILPVSALPSHKDSQQVISHGSALSRVQLLVCFLFFLSLLIQHHQQKNLPHTMKKRKRSQNPYPLLYTGKRVKSVKTYRLMLLSLLVIK
jgi:hypothetical protein